MLNLGALGPGAPCANPDPLTSGGDVSTADTGVLFLGSEDTHTLRLEGAAPYSPRLLWAGVQGMATQSNRRCGQAPGCGLWAHLTVPVTAPCWPGHTCGAPDQVRRAPSDPCLPGEEGRMVKAAWCPCRASLRGFPERRLGAGLPQAPSHGRPHVTTRGIQPQGLAGIGSSGARHQVSCRAHREVVFPK